MKKNDRAIGCALVLEICAKFGADMFGDRDFGVRMLQNNIGIPTRISQ